MTTEELQSWVEAEICRLTLDGRAPSQEAQAELRRLQPEDLLPIVLNEIIRKFTIGCDAIPYGTPPNDKKNYDFWSPACQPRPVAQFNPWEINKNS